MKQNKNIPLSQEEMELSFGDRSLPTPQPTDNAEGLPKLAVDNSKGVIVLDELRGIVFGTINSQYTHFAPVVAHYCNEYKSLKAENTSLKEDVKLLRDALTLDKKFHFAHVNDLPLYIEKAANILEIKANNEGHHSTLVEPLLKIAKKIRTTLEKTKNSI
jgi:hypothetical protein